MHSGSANVILRNNRKLLKKRKRERFVHIPGHYGELRKDKYDHVVLKPEVLKGIRERLQKERQELFKKRFVAFCIISVILLGLLLL